MSALDLVDFRLHGLELFRGGAGNLNLLGPLVVLFALQFTGFILGIEIRGTHPTLLLELIEAFGCFLLILFRLGQSIHQGQVRTAIDVTMRGAAGGEEPFEFQGGDHVGQSPIAVFRDLGGIEKIIAGGHNDGSDL